MNRVLYFLILYLYNVVIGKRIDEELKAPLGIVGGDSKHLKKVHWYVTIEKTMLLSQSRIQAISGGNVISKTAVITAAHCLENMNLSESFILVKSKYFRQGDKFRVKKIAQHRLYNPNENHKIEGVPYDIGIVWVVENFSFNEYFSPISMPDINFKKFAPLKGTVCGFGLRSLNLSHPDILNCIKIPILSCKKPLEGRMQHGIICAGNSEKNICLGDSGSGLIFHKRLLGVASRTPGCGKNGLPSFFTKITALKEWVKASGKKFRNYLDIVDYIFEHEILRNIVN